MLTRLVALTITSVLLASSIAFAGRRGEEQSTSDDQVVTQEQAQVYVVPTPEDYTRFDHTN